MKAAVTHAALNMAIIDGKLVESIVKLSENDYNALLLKAREMDAQSNGHELETAVSEIRRARMLFARVQKEDN